jgi:hypothetical protein
VQVIVINVQKAIFHKETLPCHQTVDLGNREEPPQDGSKKLVDLMEADTVITVGKEMPISRIVVAVLNTTVVLLD